MFMTPELRANQSYLSKRHLVSLSQNHTFKHIQLFIHMGTGSMRFLLSYVMSLIL